MAYMSNDAIMTGEDVTSIPSDIVSGQVHLDQSADRQLPLSKWESALRTLPYSKRAPLWSKTCTWA